MRIYGSRRSYMHIYGSVHIQKCAYMDDAYTEEIYGNPNASSIYVCFHICAFKEVVIRKCTFIRAIYGRVHIQKTRIYGRCHYGSGQLSYMRSPYMCIYKSRRLYMRIYGSAHIQKMPLWKWPAFVYASFVYAHLRKPSSVYALSVYAHIRKVHIRKKFTVIQMHLPYMHASIYAHLRKLSSINARICAYIYVHIRTTHIRKVHI
jgi:hypothetical protein